ncbi:MAG: Coenzyme F420 hydrogenase/dehydrogenase, beta subunit C-terminal domain [Clostridia bacterium]
MSDKYPLVYATRLRDKKSLKLSSSGGMFTALSDYFLDNKKAVVCAIYNYDNDNVEFSILLDKLSRDNARGSKYIQSNMLNILKQSEKFLKLSDDNEILFVGMGCQAASFKKYMQVKNLEEKITTVDIICHGSPSPKIWREYIATKKGNSKIDSLTFRDKRNGWKNPTAIVNIDKREISLKEYTNLFYNRCILRPSCHKCPYATTNRAVDMTIGDYWGIERVCPEFYDPMGNSLVLIHTDKGLELFNKIKNSLEYQLSNQEDCLQPNLKEPTPISSNRKAFWTDYKKFPFQKIINKYAKPSFKQRCIKFSRRVLSKVKRIIIKIV